MEIPIFNAFKLNVSSQKAKIAMNQALTNLEEQQEKRQEEMMKEIQIASNRVWAPDTPSSRNTHTLTLCRVEAVLFHLSYFFLEDG